MKAGAEVGYFVFGCRHIDVCTTYAMHTCVCAESSLSPALCVSLSLSLSLSLALAHMDAAGYKADMHLPQMFNMATLCLIIIALAKILL